MSAYDISLTDAFWDFPITVALVLMPIYGERNSGETNGPTYAQDEVLTARSRCRAFLKEHYNIIDDPSLPWQLGNPIH